eukprot:scaffold69152_cov23-Tisochrysis_lutea.AAC.2
MASNNTFREQTPGVRAVRCNDIGYVMEHWQSSARTGVGRLLYSWPLHANRECAHTWLHADRDRAHTWMHAGCVRGGPLHGNSVGHAVLAAAGAAHADGCEHRGGTAPGVLAPGGPVLRAPAVLCFGSSTAVHRGRHCRGERAGRGHRPQGACVCVVRTRALYHPFFCTALLS